MNILAIMYCSCLTLDPTSVIYTKMAAQKNKSCAIPGRQKYTRTNSCCLLTSFITRVKLLLQEYNTKQCMPY